MTFLAIASAGAYACKQGPPWLLPGVLVGPTAVGGALGALRQKTCWGLLWGAVAAVAIFFLLPAITIGP